MPNRKTARVTRKSDASKTVVEEQANVADPKVSNDAVRDALRNASLVKRLVLLTKPQMSVEPALWCAFASMMAGSYSSTRAALLSLAVLSSSVSATCASEVHDLKVDVDQDREKEDIIYTHKSGGYKILANGALSRSTAIAVALIAQVVAIAAFLFSGADSDTLFQVFMGSASLAHGMSLPTINFKRRYCGEIVGTCLITTIPMLIGYLGVKSHSFQIKNTSPVFLCYVIIATLHQWVRQLVLHLGTASWPKSEGTLASVLTITFIKHIFAASFSLIGAFTMFTIQNYPSTKLYLIPFALYAIVTGIRIQTRLARAETFEKQQIPILDTKEGLGGTELEIKIEELCKDIPVMASVSVLGHATMWIMLTIVRT